MIVATFKVSKVFTLSAGQAYCVPNGFFDNTNECACFRSADNLAKMDALSDGELEVLLELISVVNTWLAYNAKLEAIADKYKGQPNGTFAVMYSPAPIDISSFPIDALRYVQKYSVLVE